MNTPIYKTGALAYLIIALALGCGGNSSDSEVSLKSDYGEPPAEPVLYDKEDGNELVSEGEAPVDSTSRMLIRNGSLDFATPNLDRTMTAIDRVVDSLGGYVSSELRSESEFRQSASLKVRVPADRFEVLVRRISSLEGTLKYFRSDVEDVTEAYTDLEIRVEHLRSLEERYLNLLKSARETKDVLSIEKELNDTRTRIERLQGRMRYLSNQVRYSTLEINCYQEIDPEESSFWSDFSRNLGRGWAYFTAFLLAIVSLWPFLLLFLAIAVVLRLRRRTKRLE